MCDLGIANINRVILNEVNELVEDYNVLGFTFRESNDEVMEGVCDLIRGK